jgi:hypothetical protein
MMSPIQLRARSFWSFKLMLFSGVIGLLLLIGMPSPGFRGAADPIAGVLAVVALFLLVLSLIANLISLTNGMLAWKNGAGFCPWIIICGLLLVVPIALFILTA